MWYVIQTFKGKEEKVLLDIRRRVTEDGEEVFIIENEKMFKHHGKWEPDRQNLLPGYLFVETKRPNEFNRELRKLDRLSRLLRVDGKITPIHPEEEEFLRMIGGIDHVIHYSEGIMEGDRVIVESGALKGLEGMIKKKDRHNRQAVIGITLMGREIDVTLGLGIVRKI